VEATPEVGLVGIGQQAALQRITCGGGHGHPQHKGEDQPRADPERKERIDEQSA
jgi:hypothetical protein